MMYFGVMKGGSRDHSPLVGFSIEELPERKITFSLTAPPIKIWPGTKKHVSFPRRITDLQAKERLIGQSVLSICSIEHDCNFNLNFSSDTGKYGKMIVAVIRIFTGSGTHR